MSGQPHISVVVRDSTGAESCGALSLTSIGFALLQIWLYATTFGTFAVLPDTPISQFARPNGLPVSNLALFSALGLALCLVVAGLFPRQAQRLLCRRRVIVLAALAMSFMLVAVLLSRVFDMRSGVLSAFAGFAGGVGCAVFILLWGMVFSRMSMASTALNAICSMLLAVLAYVCLVYAVSVEVSGWVVAALPLVQLAFAWREAGACRVHFRDVPCEFGLFGKEGQGVALKWFGELSAKQRLLSLRFVAAFLFLGLALGALKSVSAVSVLTHQDQVWQLASFLIASAGALVALLVVLRCAERHRWDVLFRILLVMVVGAAFALPLLPSDFAVVSRVLMYAAYLYFEVGMWMFMVVVSRDLCLPPVVVVGLCRGVLTLSMLAGTALFLVPWTLNSTFPYGDMAPSVLIAFVMVVGFVFVPRGESVREALMPDVQDAALPVRSDDDRDSAGDLAWGSAGASVGAQAPAPASASVGALAGALAGAPAPTGALASTRAPGLARPSDSAPPASAVGEGRGAFGSADSQAARARTAAGGSLDPFEAACDEVANRYLLSRRQREVLRMLARGHNAAYVQDKLCITQSTAKSHIYNIYRKLDIHTQHELLAMVEEELERARF